MTVQCKLHLFLYVQGTYVNQQLAAGSDTYSNLDKVHSVQ